MLSWVLVGAAEAEVTPGLGMGVTGLGGPSGTRLGLPGCGGGHKEAEDEEEEEEVVVADSPSFGEAMFVLREQWMGSLEEDVELQSVNRTGGGYCVWEEKGKSGEGWGCVSLRAC